MKIRGNFRDMIVFGKGDYFCFTSNDPLPYRIKKETGYSTIPINVCTAARNSEGTLCIYHTGAPLFSRPRRYLYAVPFSEPSSTGICLTEDLETATELLKYFSCGDVYTYRHSPEKGGWVLRGLWTITDKTHCKLYEDRVICLK